MEFSQIATTIAHRVDARPLLEPARPVVVPEEDDPVEFETETLGYAEGQTFMIEYVDSKGRSSTRRVSVYNIVGGRAGIPYLLARCHERKATRQFRIDRIQCCIDYDGVVHEDVAHFLTTTFGMPISSAKSIETESSAARWKSIIDVLRADAVLLSALSRVDGKVKAVETNEAVDHLSALVERNDVFLSSSDIASIEAYVKRLRPSADAISRALSDVAGSGEKSVLRLLRAAVKVIEADEILHPEEITLVNEISRELTGIEVVQSR